MAIGNRRLLRDRPSDGAALVCEKFGRARGITCAGHGGEWSRGSVFQTGLPYRQESGGLKTPGY